MAAKAERERPMARERARGDGEREGGEEKVSSRLGEEEGAESVSLGGAERGRGLTVLISASVETSDSARRWGGGEG